MCCAPVCVLAHVCVSFDFLLPFENWVLVSIFKKRTQIKGALFRDAEGRL